jgi:hypothetical protein
MAKMALGVILVVGLSIIAAHEGWGFLLGITTFAVTTLGLGGLIVAATGLFDK